MDEVKTFLMQGNGEIIPDTYNVFSISRKNSSIIVDFKINSNILN